jgi:mitochondrial fission process protein 1
MTDLECLCRALPALTIHTVVAQSARLWKNASNPRLKGMFSSYMNIVTDKCCIAWGPTVTGLAVVPALPYLFDHPVEKVIDLA